MQPWEAGPVTLRERLRAEHERQGRRDMFLQRIRTHPLNIFHALHTRLPRFARNAIYAAAGVGVWVGAVVAANSHVTMNTVVMKQTQFWVRSDPQIRRWLGAAPRLHWRCKGGVREMRGVADVTYWVSGPDGGAQVHVKARKYDRDWRPYLLEVRNLATQETVALV